MPKGAFRIAIEDFMSTNPATNWMRDWAGRLRDRKAAATPYVNTILANDGILTRSHALETQAIGGAYMATGFEFLLDWLKTQADFINSANKSEALAKIIAAAVQNPTGQEIAEVVGSLMVDPFISYLEGYAGKIDQDPKEMMRGLVGVLEGFTVTVNLAGMAAELLSIGTVDAVKDLSDQMLHYSGVEQGTHQVISALMSVGVRPFLERYYKRLYRPTRFAASDLRDLYALGEITREQILEEGRREGWRDEDLDKWIRLAFRTLSQGDIFDALHQGFISEADAVTYLRGLGYDQTLIPLLFKLNPKKETNDAHNFSVSTARSAFKKSILSEGELRAILKGLKYTDQEIGVIIAVDRLDMQTQNKDLSVGQIKAAWQENVLSITEVRHWLGEIAIGKEEQDILIATWQEETQPVYRKLNAGTILNAYLEAVINKNQAFAKLKEIGFTEEDATLQLNLVEAQNPEAFGKPARTKEKLLTVGTLATFYVQGLLTEAQLRQRIETIGYPPEDVDLYVKSANLQLVTANRELTPSTIQAGYVTGVLSRSQAFDRLRELDYTEADANTILNITEEQNIDIFHPELVQVVRTPSVSALQTAVLYGIIDENEFTARMTELGYSLADAELYLSLIVTTPKKATKTLSASNIVNAYGAGIFTYNTAMRRLTELGYSIADSEVLLLLEKQTLTDTDEWNSMLAGQLNPVDTISGLFTKHYTEQDLETAFNNIDPILATQLGIDVPAIIAYLQLFTKAE
jgi:hypothetical protein